MHKLVSGTTESLASDPVTISFIFLLLMLRRLNCDHVIRLDQDPSLYVILNPFDVIFIDDKIPAQAFEY